MNPRNPTSQDMRLIENVFFNQMKRLSHKAAYPNAHWMHTLDLQFSDRWVSTP